MFECEPVGFFFFGGLLFKKEGGTLLKNYDNAQMSLLMIIILMVLVLVLVLSLLLHKVLNILKLKSGSGVFALKSGPFLVIVISQKFQNFVDKLQ